jgi:hypothetical protein
VGGQDRAPGTAQRPPCSIGIRPLAADAFCQVHTNDTITQNILIWSLPRLEPSSPGAFLAVNGLGARGA